MNRLNFEAQTDFAKMFMSYMPSEHKPNFRLVNRSFNRAFLIERRSSSSSVGETCVSVKTYRPSMVEYKLPSSKLNDGWIKGFGTIYEITERYADSHKEGVYLIQGPCDFFNGSSTLDYEPLPLMFDNYRGVMAFYQRKGRSLSVKPFWRSEPTNRLIIDFDKWRSQEDPLRYEGTIEHPKDLTVPKVKELLKDYGIPFLQREKKQALINKLIKHLN